MVILRGRIWSWVAVVIVVGSIIRVLKFSIAKVLVAILIRGISRE